MFQHRRRVTSAIGAFLFVAICATAPQARGAVGDCTPGNPLMPEAEMFATNNTDTIADPADPRLQDQLQPFESQVDSTVLANAALPVGSDLVHGIYWSEDMQQLTFESSREFHLACVGDDELTHIAEDVARRFDQESVLIFSYRPDGGPPGDSFIADVPGVDQRRFFDALKADPDARTRLGGGSISQDGSLVLVASDRDADVAKRVVAASGGVLDMSTVRQGTSRFVP